jgi:hypothetical protein
VADYLQERVFDDGPRWRLDACKLLFRNAFDSADDVLPKLDFAYPAVEKRRSLLSRQIQQHRPPVILTFGDQAYRFVSFASASNQSVPARNLKVEDIGETFRNVLHNFGPQQVNVIPLLHASVARASWATVGAKFSGNGEENYFRYVGHGLGDLLLRYGRGWPIWRDSARQGR